MEQQTQTPQSMPPGIHAGGPPHFGTLNRPARRQADQVDKWDTDATDYNIWYNKKCGDYRAKRIEGREAATYRCQILRDAGTTKSDENSYICVYFARGKCVRGADCTFHHRIPDERDEAKLDLTYDVFGRERHRTDRDDMGGVGTFSRENRTLYIGGVRRVKGVDLQELIVRNFIEFGELESVRVIWDKSIAFVRYKLRAASEFAKEAMADQSLGYKEVLNVRWANEDPNPRAQRENKIAVANQAYNAIMEHGGPAPYPDMSTLATGDAYPTTDGQYMSVEAVPAEYQQALQYASPYYPAAQQPYYPAPVAQQEEESALSMLSAYDAESYAERYGSVSSSSSSSSSSSDNGDGQQQQQHPQSASSVAPAPSASGNGDGGQQTHSDYTPEQWRQWYMYYYGYVPSELPPSETEAAPSSAVLPAAGPAVAATSAQPAVALGDGPAKKLRTK